MYFFAWQTKDDFKFYKGIDAGIEDWGYNSGTYDFLKTEVEV